MPSQVEGSPADSNIWGHDCRDAGVRAMLEAKAESKNFLKLTRKGAVIVDANPVRFGVDG